MMFGLILNGLSLNRFFIAEKLTLGSLDVWKNEFPLV
jgi:hypothetical protein